MQCSEEVFLLNDYILPNHLSNLLQFKLMQGHNAEATAVTETPSSPRIQLTVQQLLDDKNVQASQGGYVMATRRRGVAGDEEKDQRDCSHPHPPSEKANEARRPELRASDANGKRE